MSRWIRLGCALLLALFSGSANALTESQFQTLDIRAGLPSQQVNSLAQDRDGHLWIGTKDGLARYDGRRFQVYRHLPGDETSLPSNYIGVVHVDRDNRIWVAVEGYGIYRMNADQVGFSAMPLNGMSRGLDVWSIVSDADGALWFGSFGQGLYRRTADGHVQHFMPSSDGTGLPDENVLAMAIGSDQTVWIGTSSGLILWRHGRFIPYDNAQLPSKLILNIIPDGEFGIWIGTQAGLALIGPDGKAVRPAWHAKLSHHTVLNVLRESDGVRWVVTNKGLNRIENGEVRIFYPKVSFISAYQDRQGGFWFGSEQGILRQPKSWRYFNSYQVNEGNSGLRNLELADYAVRPDGSLLLVGSSAELEQFWPETGRIVPIEFDRRAVKSTEFRAVFEDEQGRIWLGGNQELLRVDGPGAIPKIWHKQSPINASLLGPVRHLQKTADQLLWVAYYGGGLQARDAEGNVLHTITPKSGHGLQFPDPEQLFKGPDGQLWLVGGEGILRWDAKKAGFIRPPGSPQERLYSAFVGPEDTLWIGRLGQLDSYRWLPQSGELRKLSSFAGDDGLPAVEISGIAFDGRGDAWLSTSRGLLRFNIKQRRSRLYGINDGLISQEFDVRAPLIGRNGLAIALSKQELVSYRPESMGANPMPPRLVLEQVSVRRQEDQVALDKHRKIEMQPSDRDLTIEALLLNFEDFNSQRYRSRLSGFDPDWIEMGSNGTRVFSKLPPGKYRLQTIAANAEGIWSAPQTLEIKVLPPIWNTWWAYVFYSLLMASIFALLTYGHRLRMKRRHEQQIQAQQREFLMRSTEAKSQFLANLGHEIRTPMTGVLGMTELLLAGALPEKPKTQVQAIQKAGEHLLRLMNDALDLSKIEAGQFTLDDHDFDLSALMSEVQELLSPLAQRKNLQFELQLSSGLNVAYHGDSGRIRQILYNLGNNAIKFTSSGCVCIRVQPLLPKGIMVSVIDTGPGLSAEQQGRLFHRFVQADGARTAHQFGGSGLGLAISKELANLMGGEIEVRSQLGEGSQFTVTLPLEGALAAVECQLTSGDGPGLQISQLNLLLVEDDETIATVLQQMLVKQGHQIALASHALDALTLTAGQHFDAIFCDVDLPGLNGLELTRIWRQLGLLTPIIALTARTQADAEAECIEAGMSGFLRKPVTGAQLAQAMQAAGLN